MQIAFIGYGSMAKALASRWAPSHQVVFSGRNPEKAVQVACDIGHGATAAATEREAVHGSDVVVLATRSEGTLDAVDAAGGPQTLADSIIIDINNPVPGAFDGDFSVLSFDGRSLAEAVAERSESSKVVKAFNMAQAEVWTRTEPSTNTLAFTTFIAGDDADAKAAVAPLVEATGSIPFDIGGLKYARHLESAAGLVIKLLFSGHSSMTVLNLNVLPRD